MMGWVTDEVLKVGLERSSLARAELPFEKLGFYCLVIGE
jgi:hypothetical protein